MPTPIMITTGVSATGDIVTGTAVNFLVHGLPIATLTSPVAGPMCAGVLSVSTAVNKLVHGLPMANITSVATGANPITGVPVTTAAVVTTGINYIC